MNEFVKPFCTIVALTAFLLLPACQNMPEPYAPPIQREPFERARPYRISRIVSMTDGDADAHIVQDIPKQIEGSWRWVQQKPTVRVVPRTNLNLKYVIDFSIPEVTFKVTGPVTMSFYVNDHLLDRARYAAAGQLHFEKPVPADWVTPNKDTTVAAEIDKMWVSPEDGTRLGFILTRMGLTQ